MIFLFELKMGFKAAETTHNINNSLAQKLLMNTQCSGGSRSFAKETSFEDEFSDQPSEIDNNQLRAIT